MQASEPKFELTVLGATGFTGRQAARYLAACPPGSFRWAIAGRSEEKVKSLFDELSSAPNPPAARRTVDHSDRGAVFRAVEDTRVVLSFAGPFARYGENLVAACAELGRHYLDITGETFWAREMIERYGDTARRSGAVMIPFSGFDSVPSDLGVWHVLEKARSVAPNRSATKVVGIFSVSGGINGGTFETMLGTFEHEAEAKSKGTGGQFRNPASLLPDFPEEIRNRFEFPLPRKPVHSEALGSRAPAFFMAPVNTPVVYRSQALRMAASGSAGRPVEYVELLKPPRVLPGAQAWAMSLSGEALERIGRFRAGRKLLALVGPKPGQGPSEEAQENGFFRARFYAYSGPERVAESEISYPGDPGNKATTLLVCESALCLIRNEAALAPIRGGFQTPSTALGAALRDRLVRAGAKIV